MKEIKYEKTDLLYSLALFSEIYNKNQNIFSLISNLVLYCIYDSNSGSVDIEGICDVFEKKFSLNVPKTVIKKSLRMLKKNRIIMADDSEYYSIIDNAIKKDIKEVDREISNSENSLEKTLNAIYREYEEKTKSGLSEENKLIIANKIQNILLNDSKTDFDDYDLLCSIIKSEKFESIETYIEGVIIYKGLLNSDIGSKIPFFKGNKITYFLDTEHLFSLAGLHDGIYNDIANNFIKLVKKAQCLDVKVNLYYFRQTKKQIDNIFDRVISLKEKGEHINRGKTAYISIANKGKTKDAIKRYQSDFYYELEKKGIKEYEIKDNHIDENCLFKDNIFDLLVDMFKDDPEQQNNRLFIRENEIHDTLQIFSVLKSLRGNRKVENLETLKYIFITNTSSAYKVSDILY